MVATGSLRVFISVPMSSKVTDLNWEDTEAPQVDKVWSAWQLVGLTQTGDRVDWVYGSALRAYLVSQNPQPMLPCRTPDTTHLPSHPPRPLPLSVP